MFIVASRRVLILLARCRSRADGGVRRCLKAAPSSMTGRWHSGCSLAKDAYPMPEALLLFGSKVCGVAKSGRVLARFAKACLSVVGPPGKSPGST